MNVLVIGGTRFFGVHMVRELLKEGHEVTIATRGITKDSFGDSVKRIIIERTSSESLKDAFRGKCYDVVCDNLSYCSNDVKALLDNVKFKRYIMTSSASAYFEFKLNMKENDFDPFNNELKWCSREDFAYDEIKRQAETALFRHYSQKDSAAVRFPYVVGNDDYTKRLYFYVEHVVKSIPMYVNNLESELAFIRSDDAGKFLVYLAKSNYCGPINACSTGTIKIKDIIHYVETKTGFKAVYSEDADKAPYNYTPSYYLNTEQASNIGYEFLPLNTWIYDLLDEYILLAKTVK